MKNIFSAIRPSGKLHLGNYLGAVKNWVELQDNAERAVFAVVDLHGITTPYEPAKYPEWVMDVVLDYLAAGVDPKKSLLIRQSKIPQHTELMWLLSTITPIAWLERLPTYREKLQQVKETGGERAKSYQNNLGILAYPVLMAADILLYRANLVPVGEDQFMHINIANEIAYKFNGLFDLPPGRTGGQDETFSNIKAYHAGSGERIRSLQDPTAKMSKSGDDGIALTDSSNTIRAKIKKAVTDSGKDIKYDEKQKPAVSNLLTIMHLLSGKEMTVLENEYERKTYAQFKEDLAEIIIQFLKPFQEKRAMFSSDMPQVIAMLESSENKARAIAEETMSEVRSKMGL